MSMRFGIGFTDLTYRGKAWIVRLDKCETLSERFSIMVDLAITQHRLALVSRMILAAVFIYGGVPKLFSPHDFARIISAYGLVPETLVFPVAIVLPLIEVITAIGLVLNYRWAIVTSLLLLLFFIAVLSYGILLGLDIDCGCFGIEEPEHDAFSTLSEARIRDLLLLFPAGYSWWFIHSTKENK